LNNRNCWPPWTASKVSSTSSVIRLGTPGSKSPGGGAIEIDHGAAHAQKRARAGQVFQPRDRRLGAKLAIGRRQIHRHLEQRIVAQARGVVAVLVAGGDHQQSKTNDPRKGG
jgi:hypothetical protein